MHAKTDSDGGSAAPKQQAANCWEDKEKGGHDPINCLRIIAAPSRAFATLDSRQQRRLLNVNLQRLLPLQLRKADVRRGRPIGCDS
jgi:hypothetical protein